MGEGIIDNTVWSYSRLKTFDECPYRWYLKYVLKLPERPLFFSGYGSFLHELLCRYVKGEATREELVVSYLTGFRSSVVGKAPNGKIFESYFQSALRYMRGVEPFPLRILSAEERYRFDVNGIQMVGIVDVLGERDDGLIIIDHKSRALRPRSGRIKPTKTDRELDEYLVQLYLYAAAVKQRYGRYPKSLCFNCFRTPVFIEEPFSELVLKQAEQWVTDRVERIGRERSFSPDIEYFKCAHLCEMSHECEYYALWKGE